MKYQRIISKTMVIIVLFTSVLSSQMEVMKKEPFIKENEQSYAIPGSHVLLKQWEKEKEILKNAGVRPVQPSLKKRESYGFNVGDQRSWYATDMSSSNNYEYLVPSTCRAVGNNCYIFVEDASWAAQVTQAAVDSLLIAFEERTPANPTKGIYQVDTLYFGQPPDVDNDPKIIILVLDIKDGYSGSGNFVAGYYYSINQYLDDDVQRFLGTNRHSNEAEIYYVDCNPAVLTTTNGLKAVAATTAHEFQHMIHWNYHRDEITFVGEGCSEIAEVLCGYGLRSPSAYYSNTDVIFLSWNETGDPLPDYARAAIFTLYLVEQYGNSITRQIVKSTLSGEAGYNAALSAVGANIQFKDVMKSFVIATKLNRKDYNSKYGFEYTIPIVPSDHYQFTTPTVQTTSTSLMPYGTKYITYTNGTSINFQLSSESPLAIKAIAIGNSNVLVESVENGQQFSLNDFGTNYTTVTFAVTNLSTAPINFTFQSSGTGGTSALELKYDITEPTGFLPLNEMDTVCVWFQGISGMKLDSIRVALRRAGTITGGVWRYTGSLRPTPLGQKLAFPITASETQTPSVPYPVPWPNWASIDLRSYNIDASAPFAVAFIVSGNASTTPRVMVTESPLPSVITSYTYLNSSSNWYYITSDDNGDSVYTYLIRAYVSNPTLKTPAVEIQPASFQLSQNYPNPFNPGTSFHYVLPKDDYVTLKIYDLLGREVMKVYEGFSPKENTIYWTPDNLPSGVYIYSLQSSYGVQTKKLLYLK